MNETEVITYDFNCEIALRDIKPRHVFREGIVLDQHRHQVSGRGLHDDGQVLRVPVRVVQLFDPQSWILGGHRAQSGRERANNGSRMNETRISASHNAKGEERAFVQMLLVFTFADLTKHALANDLHGPEVYQTHLGPL